MVTARLIQTGHQMRTTGTGCAGAYGELTSKLGLAGGGERRAFLVPDPDPFNLASADRIGERVEQVADQSEDMLDPNPLQHIDQNIRDCLRHLAAPLLKSPSPQIPAIFRSFGVSRP